MSVDWYILDDNNNPVPCTDSEANDFMLNRREKKIIGRTEVNGHCVSTVFLCLDHSWMQGGRPVLFETLVFESPDIYSEINGERYHTYDEAVAGHQKWVDWVKNGEKQENL